MAQNKIKGFKVNGVEYGFDIEIPIPEVGKITAPNGTEYTLKVNNQGELYTEDEASIPAPISVTASGLCLDNVLINEIYCGGTDSNEHTLNYCSHNFVEICNLTKNDINLEGCSLQYAITENNWEVLPLKGVVKSGSTFLIRGAQCSVLDSPICKIHVDTYDMEWYTKDGKLITFSNDVGAKFYLTAVTDKYAGNSPYDKVTKRPATDALGYLSFVNIQGTGLDASGEGGAPIKNLSGKNLYKRYYNMDGGKKAAKAIDARNNSTEWNYVDLTKENGELLNNMEDYKPCASFEGKNLFTDKTKLSLEKPSMITCSFGIQATDAGEGATRCFNWVAKNTGDRYLWVRTSGSTTWNIVNGAESFHEGDGRTEYANSIYNSISKEYSDHGVFIANKYIKAGIPAGTYEYTAGRRNLDGTPNLEHCLDIRKFVVRADEDVEDNISFVQTSDQQSFNWTEYQMWKTAANTIVKESGDTVQFMINTGDMTQNGNRMNEWLDYFDGKGLLNNMEEMATIGNNDLSHRNLYEYSVANDNDKVWHENITFFYTFEMDEDNPTIFKGADDADYYIPSLYSFNYGNVHFMCINSEIKQITETSNIAYNFGDGKWGTFYPQIKEWCEADVEKNSDKKWTVVYCHEMPFTIMVPKVTEKADHGEARSTDTGSCSLNLNSKEDTYWFSEFCQTHNIPLVLGGHKHTETVSYKLLENVKYEGDVRTVDSLHPIIVVNEEILDECFSGATSLVEYNGYNYPNTWIKDEAPIDTIGYSCDLCTFMMESDIPTGVTPVVYAMSQATGYKHTSNKELPGMNIPWLHYYYARKSYDAEENSAKANEGQCFPFYTIWKITDEKITGNVRKVWGGFNASGKFDINVEGSNVFRGLQAPGIHKDWMDTKLAEPNKIFSVNGLYIQTDTTGENSYDCTTIIEIKR